MEKVKWSVFLKDVLTCSLSAYGGPEAHYGIFTEQLVEKKKYIKENDLLELIALTSILPGPSSSQTIVAIGYKLGGPLLAFLTMLVWALPLVVFMMLLAIVSIYISSLNFANDIFRYVGPMAIAFVVVAAYRISSQVVVDRMTFILLIFGAVVTYFVREAWVYPSVLLVGALVTIFSSKEKDIWNKTSIKPPWIYFVLFLTFAIMGIFLSQTSDNLFVKLFESFYRYGYLVIGGGQVVVAMMYSDLVEIHSYLSGQEFLLGFGLVQALPGPMFSFASFVGTMAASDEDIFIQVIAGLISGISIFLPGLLLIYFVYPIWQNLKEIKAIKLSLKGITAVAGGLIISSVFSLLEDMAFNVDNILFILVSIVAIFSKKIPIPVIVVGVILAGIIL